MRREGDCNLAQMSKASRRNQRNLALRLVLILHDVREDVGDREFELGLDGAGGQMAYGLPSRLYFPVGFPIPPAVLSLEKRRLVTIEIVKPFFWRVSPTRKGWWLGRGESIKRWLTKHWKQLIGERPSWAILVTAIVGTLVVAFGNALGAIILRLLGF
jgi:hypothetical protein